MRMWRRHHHHKSAEQLYRLGTTFPSPPPSSSYPTLKLYGAGLEQVLVFVDWHWALHAEAGPQVDHPPQMTHWRFWEGVARSVICLLIFIKIILNLTWGLTLCSLLPLANTVGSTIGGRRVVAWPTSCLFAFTFSIPELLHVKHLHHDQGNQKIDLYFKLNRHLWCKLIDLVNWLAITVCTIQKAGQDISSPDCPQANAKS